MIGEGAAEQIEHAALRECLAAKAGRRLTLALPGETQVQIEVARETRESGIVAHVVYDNSKRLNVVGPAAQLTAFARIRAAKNLSFKLREHRDLAHLSKRLATVATDAPVPAAIGLDDLAWRGPDLARVEPLFGRLGFKRIRDRVG